MWITLGKTLLITCARYPHIHINHCENYPFVVIHSVIIKFLVRFPQIFDEKRYKLINFAPKLEIVDKWIIQLIITKKIYTRLLITPSPHVDIQWTKKIEK